MNSVDVINTTTNTVSTTITVGTNPMGISVSPDGSKVYVANDGSFSVSVISTATNTVTGTISVGTSPFGLSISPSGNKVYAVNSTTNSVSVINTSTNTVSATIPVGIGPYGVSVSLNGSKVYVANDNGNSISVIDTITNTVSATISVGNNPYAFGNFISTYPIINSGIETQYFDAENIILYPNPTSGQITVALQSDNAEIIVTDLLGQQIIKTKATQKATNLQLDNNGVYIVYVTTKQGTTARKLIVNR